MSIRAVKEVAQATQLANGSARIQAWSVSATLRLCARHTVGLIKCALLFPPLRIEHGLFYSLKYLQHSKLLICSVNIKLEGKEGGREEGGRLAELWANPLQTRVL